MVGGGGGLFRATDTLQIEWASCLGFVATVLNASGNQIHLHILYREGETGWERGQNIRGGRKSVKER